VSPDRPAQGAERPAVDAEQEVDVGRYWWAIVHRWWLVVLAVAVGIVVGLLVSLGGGRVFQGKATVYLGQPLSPSGNSQVQGLQTNPSTVSQIVHSETTIRSVADTLGVAPGKLRVSAKPVAGAVAKLGQTQLVEIVVRSPLKRQSADAANALARIVVEQVSQYANTKIEQLEALVDSQDAHLATAEDTIARYRSAAESGASLSTAERLVLVGLLDSAEQERGQLVEDRAQTALALALAKDVERGQVVTEATATKVAARGRRSAMLVGAVLGLVVGAALALLWEPLSRRLPRGR